MLSQLSASAGKTARVLFWLLVVGSGLTACGSMGSYVWYYDFPKAEWGENIGEYVIGVSDQLRIQVFEQDAINTSARVRPDGRIALPFVGEITAAGKHPQVLARELEARLKAFIVNPRVTVNVEEAKPVVVSTLGEVGVKGTITLDRSVGILQAIALAGGLTEYANKSAIFVVRRSPEFRRIRFTYNSLMENEHGAATFSLRTGDIILVE